MPLSTAANIVLYIKVFSVPYFLFYLINPEIILIWGFGAINKNGSIYAA